MLFPDQGVPLGVQVAQIHDQHRRIPPFGPFKHSYEFYVSRWLSLNQYYKSTPSGRNLPDPSRIISDDDMPVAIQTIVNQRMVSGPFYLAHPDYRISNFLFDDEYNITALLDWSACQTVPLESFLNQPKGIVPDPDALVQSTYGRFGFPNFGAIRDRWGRCRTRFLEEFKKGITGQKDAHILYEMINSCRPVLATTLDTQGIMGIQTWITKDDMDILRAEHDKEEMKNN